MAVDYEKRKKMNIRIFFIFGVFFLMLILVSVFLPKDENKKEKIPSATVTEGGPKSNEDAIKKFIEISGQAYNSENEKIISDYLSKLKLFFSIEDTNFIVSHLELYYNKSTKKKVFPDYCASFLSELSKMGFERVQELSVKSNVDEIKYDPLAYMLITYNATLVVNGN